MGLSSCSFRRTIGARIDGVKQILKFECTVQIRRNLDVERWALNKGKSSSDAQFRIHLGVERRALKEKSAHIAL